jgi:hypothetical protein
MTDFIQNAVEDMRGGRQSWRVITTLAVPSFAISFVIATLQYLH